MPAVGRFGSKIDDWGLAGGATYRWENFYVGAAAGWSKDKDGVLDARRVSDVSIGWGGYLGREGETVQFAIRTPLTAQ